MEAKFLAVFSVFSIFFTISINADDSNIEYESAIYYGDSNINLGEPFIISCVVPISDPIFWLKDGKPITEHNLRHGRDEHSFLISESAIEGENDRIEAHLSVKHALKVHEGKYQCNDLYSSYHMLRVRGSDKVYLKPHFNTELVTFPITTVNEQTREWSQPTTTDTFTNLNYSWHQMPAISTTMNLPKLPIIFYNDTPNFIEYEESPDPTELLQTFNEKHQISQNLNTPIYPERIPTTTNIFEPTTRVFESTIYEQPKQTQYFANFKQRPTTMEPKQITPIPPTIFKSILKEDLLVPNYDNAEHKLKVYDIKNPLVLSCNITKVGDYELIWEKNGTDVHQIDHLKDRFTILKAERKFMISKTSAKDDGLYSCVLDNERKDFNVIAALYVAVPSHTGVVEGEKLTIHCTVLGTDPRIHWEYRNLTFNNSTERVFLKPDENKIENAILTIENVSLEDRGEYKCVARNLATDYANKPLADDFSFVRVKGKLAALWPFLGICAEVLILCTIILIYEKRRNKSELEESDTDPNTEHDGQSDNCNDIK